MADELVVIKNTEVKTIFTEAGSIDLLLEELSGETNNPLKITNERLREWKACSSGYSWFLQKFPQGGMFADVYSELKKDRRHSDSDWLINKVFSELDTTEKTAQIVFITGADKAKIEQQVKECGGNEANAVTTSDEANAVTTGDGANAATTGNGANAVTTGYWANAVTTGDGANAVTEGNHAVAAALGIESKAKAGVGGAIVLCHRNDEGHLIHIRASKVGENGIKPNTWYSLDKNGEFAEESA